MELQHINVKLYLQDSRAVKLEALVPVFMRGFRTGCVMNSSTLWTTGMSMLTEMNWTSNGLALTTQTTGWASNNRKATVEEAITIVSQAYDPLCKPPATESREAGRFYPL
jgi:hypothetical protein